MASNTKPPATGGNKPKPTGAGNTPSAKDKSRAASRPVTAKAPGKGAMGGNSPKPLKTDADILNRKPIIKSAG